MHENKIEQLDKDAEIARLKGENQQLRLENQELKERIIVLEKLVQDLQAQLRQFIVKKNSSNSSMPPSTDLTRKSESLRTERRSNHGH